jgi:lysophospholipase L1-like esterase
VANLDVDCSLTPTTTNIIMPNSLLRYLALGDSYTIGEGVQPAENWPNQLTRVLRKDEFLFKDAHIIAQTGWTTHDLIEAIHAANPRGPYDLVTLLIGVNNQYQDGDLEVYCEEFSTLLGLAINFTAGFPSQVLVLSVPDWGVTPYAEGRDRNKIRAQIDQFNKINKSVSETAGVHYIDITTISRLLSDVPELLASDNLHFSGEMYAAWVDLLRPVILRTLSPNERFSTAPFTTTESE